MIKKINDFINDMKAIEKQHKINELERDIFQDIIEKLINSNNIEKMKEYINFMDGKLSLSLNQFVHKKIFELKNKNVDIKNINIDYVDLNNKIDLFKKK
jgi:hypothetical protein